jgi:hypothetical protein
VESSGAVAWEVVPGVELVAEMAVVASPAAGAKAAAERAEAASAAATVEGARAAAASEGERAEVRVGVARAVAE